VPAIWVSGDGKGGDCSSLERVMLCFVLLGWIWH